MVDPVTPERDQEGGEPCTDGRRREETNEPARRNRREREHRTDQESQPEERGFKELVADTASGAGDQREEHALKRPTRLHRCGDARQDRKREGRACRLQDEPGRPGLRRVLESPTQDKEHARRQRRERSDGDGLAHQLDSDLANLQPAPGKQDVCAPDRSYQRSVFARRVQTLSPPAEMSAHVSRPSRHPPRVASTGWLRVRHSPFGRASRSARKRPVHPTVRGGWRTSTSKHSILLCG